MAAGEEEAGRAAIIGLEPAGAAEEEEEEEEEEELTVFTDCPTTGRGSLLEAAELVLEVDLEGVAGVDASDLSANRPQNPPVDFASAAAAFSLAPESLATGTDGAAGDFASSRRRATTGRAATGDGAAASFLTVTGGATGRAAGGEGVAAGGEETAASGTTASLLRGAAGAIGTMVGSLLRKSSRPKKGLEGGGGGATGVARGAGGSRLAGGAGATAGVTGVTAGGRAADAGSLMRTAAFFSASSLVKAWCVLSRERRRVGR